MILVFILSFCLVLSLAANVKLYRDFVLYRSAYRRVSSMASQTTLLMGATVLIPHIIAFIQRKLSK